MALTLTSWNNLSPIEKNDVVNFLIGNCKIDCEKPASHRIPAGGYPIADGITSGGHPMKYGEEYRIYIDNINGIPPFLENELKEPGTRNRIGGSDAIKAIMVFGGLTIGRN